jgi:hypothetical protein
MTTAIQTTARTQTTSQRRRGLRCSMDSGLPYRKRVPAATASDPPEKAHRSEPQVQSSLAV